jgi:hypothetical protein
MRALQANATSSLVLQVLLDRDTISNTNKNANNELYRDRLAASLAKCFGPAESNAIRRGLELTSSSSASSHHHHHKGNLEQYIQESPLLNPLWKKTVLAASRLSDNNNVVHALIQTKAKACVMALALAMSEDPREALLQQDKNGQRPLEVFLQQDDEASEEGSTIARGHGAAAPDSANFILQLMVQAHPDSCTLVSSSGTGQRLPLHLAITANRKFTWHASLVTVFEAHTEAVRIRDPVTELYPFQLAAAAPHAEETTIFELLRTDPSVLRF